MNLQVPSYIAQILVVCKKQYIFFIFCVIFKSIVCFNSVYLRDIKKMELYGKLFKDP